MTPEQRSVKRKEYNNRYKEKYPDRSAEQERTYREKNKEKIRIKASKWQKEKYRKNKLLAIEYLGGFCIDCIKTFHPSVYDFHHLDSEKKEATIARIMGRKWENIKPELDKCVLLCSNCHRLRHNDYDL